MDRSRAPVSASTAAGSATGGRAAPISACHEPRLLRLPHDPRGVPHDPLRVPHDPLRVSDGPLRVSDGPRRERPRRRGAYSDSGRSHRPSGALAPARSYPEMLTVSGVPGTAVGVNSSPAGCKTMQSGESVTAPDPATQPGEP